MTGEMETITIEREAERCEDGADIRALLHRYDKFYVNWKNYINCMLDESGLSYNQFAARCGISKNTVKKWCIYGGLPRSRDTFLKLGFGMGMNVTQVNHLLNRYGGYHALYPKDLFDAVCIFTLNRRTKVTDGYDYNFAKELYNRCLSAQAGGITETASTVEVMGKLLEIDSESEFTVFASQNKNILKGERPKLEQYLRDFITVRELEAKREEGHEVSWHGLAKSMGIPSKFEKDLSGLHTHGIIPRRERLIALGIYLGMVLDEINAMLKYAGMERLCAKDKLECVLIYALQNLCLLHPELPLGNAMQLLAVTRCPEMRALCETLVEEYMSACYQSENNDWGELSNYVRKVLEEIDIDESEELLNLL